MQSTPDEVLIGRIANGDRLAMQVLYARYHVRVFRFVVRLVRDEATAEDVISEVFLDVWRQAGRFEGRSTVSTWLLAIGRFKAISALRRRPDEELDEEAAAAIEDLSDNPATALEKRASGWRSCSSRRELKEVGHERDQQGAGASGDRSSAAMVRGRDAEPPRANRVAQALAGDRELARQYDLVREELVETIHLNETLGAPSARAMEKLFAAIDAEEARAQRDRRSVDLGGRISEFLSSLTPRTLAWSATAAAVAILMQAAVIAAVVVKDQGAPSGPSLASAPSEGSFAVVRFAPQATANDITNFLGAYKAKVVEGPLNMGGQLYRIRLSETKLPKDEVGKIVQQMQAESKVVGFIAARE